MTVVTESTLVEEIYKRYGQNRAKQNEARKRSFGSGVYVTGERQVNTEYIYENTVSLNPKPEFTAIDGYVRRSPIQRIRTKPGYRAAIVKRVTGFILLAAVVMFVIYVIIFIGILG